MIGEIYFITTPFLKIHSLLYWLEHGYQCNKVVEHQELSFKIVRRASAFFV